MDLGAKALWCNRTNSGHLGVGRPAVNYASSQLGVLEQIPSPPWDTVSSSITSGINAKGPSGLYVLPVISFGQLFRAGAGSEKNSSLRFRPLDSCALFTADSGSGGYGGVFGEQRALCTAWSLFCRVGQLPGNPAAEPNRASSSWWCFPWWCWGVGSGGRREGEPSRPHNSTGE